MSASSDTRRTVDVTLRYTYKTEFDDTYHIIPVDEPFASLFDEITQKENVESGLRFFYNDKELSPTNTPEGSSIDNYETIFVKINHSIIIQLQGISSAPSQIRIPSNSALGKILSKLCKKLGLDWKNFTFEYKSRKILDKMTPKDYGMTNGDIIKAIPKDEPVIVPKTAALSQGRISIQIIGIDGTSHTRSVDPNAPMKRACSVELKECGETDGNVKFFVGETLIDEARTFVEYGIKDGDVITMKLRKSRSQTVQAPAVVSQTPEKVSFVVRFEKRDFKISMNRNDIMGLFMKKMCESMKLDSNDVRFSVVDEDGEETRLLSYMKPEDAGLDSGSYIKMTRFTS